MLVPAVLNCILPPGSGQFQRHSGPAPPCDGIWRCRSRIWNYRHEIREKIKDGNNNVDLFLLQANSTNSLRTKIRGIYNPAEDGIVSWVCRVAAATWRIFPAPSMIDLFFGGCTLERVFNFLSIVFVPHTTHRLYKSSRSPSNRTPIAFLQAPFVPTLSQLPKALVKHYHSELWLRLKALIFRFVAIRSSLH
jgi:hypothetical protein